MNESTRKKIVYIGAVIGLTWAAFNYDWTEEIPDIPQLNSTTATVVPTMPENKVRIVDQQKSKIINTTDLKNHATVERYENFSWGKDPFRPWTKSKTVVKKKNNRALSWIVNGILYSHDNPLAYVNGSSVKIGDIVQGAKVINIDRKSVTFDKNGTRFTVKVKKG